MRQRCVRPLLLMLVVVASAGCWKTADTRRSTIANTQAKTVPAIRLRAPELAEVTVVASSGLDDGSLIVVGSSLTGVRDGKDVRCSKAGETAFIARFEATTKLRWMKCVQGDPRLGMVGAASSSAGVAIARIVDSSANTQSDVRDLIVVDRFTLAGEPAGSQVVGVFYDPKHDSNSARNVAENSRLSTAVFAGDELVIAGVSKSGSIVDGQWRVPESYISMHGFVLSVPKVGPVRAVFESSNVLFEDVSVAGRRFVASGWCSSGAGTTTNAPPRVVCSGSTTVFSVDGSLDGGSAPRIRVYGSDMYEMRSAMAEDGAIVVAATSWRSAVTIGGTELASTCAKFPFVARFTAAGTLDYARVLGDCRQSVQSPFANGGTSSAADDQNSDHTFSIHDVAIVGGDLIVVVGIDEDTNHLDWPVRFDSVKVAVPFGHSAAAFALDARGKVIRHRVLDFKGPSEVQAEPDATLARGAGVHRVIVTSAGSQAWLVVEHAGGLEVDGTRYRVRTGFESPVYDDEPDNRCDARAIRRPPVIAEVIDSIANRGGEPADFRCRRTVTAEVAVEAMQL